MTRIEDRIAPNSGSHFALFALVEYENRFNESVTAEELYVATDRIFPNAEWLADTLDELIRRNLATYSDGEYAPNSNGRVAIKRHDKPRNAPWDRPDPPGETVSETDGSTDDEDDDEADPFPDEPWEPTAEDGIYYGSEADRGPFSGAGRNTGMATARELRSRLPEYDIVITVGPHRMQDVAYVLDTERQRIRLDFYSVRPNEHVWKDALMNDVHTEALEQQKWADNADTTTRQ